MNAIIIGLVGTLERSSNRARVFESRDDAVIVSHLRPRHGTRRRSVVDPIAGPALNDGRDIPVLELIDVVQEFKVRGFGWHGARAVRVLSHVSCQVSAGETLGIIGESGSGKTTLARTILQMPAPTSGQIRFCGVELSSMRGRRLRQHRRGIQMIFQDPPSSLNPRWRVAEVVEEPLIGEGMAARSERRRRVDEALTLVGLPASRFAERRPTELSGGQCQRVAIARAIVAHPRLIVCDEAVSSLDALVQAQIIDLFQKLRRDRSLAYLFISHDLAVVEQISDRIAVLYSGQLCEIGPTATISQSPRHPYTRALLASVPFDPEASFDDTLRGEPPSQFAAQNGCRYHTRCPVATAHCVAHRPELTSVGANHFVACHFPETRRGSERGP